MKTKQAGNGTLLGRSANAESYGVGPSFSQRRWQSEALRDFKKMSKDARGGYFEFLLYAGVGSGKTMWSAMVSAFLLNAKLIDRIVYVCPNRSIRNRVAVEYRAANVHLVRWNPKKHSDRLPPGIDGVVMTYQSLIRDCLAHAEFCVDSKTFVIFDEIHHLGDGLSWGESAEKAFKRKAAAVLGMTGTPYRSDNHRIPFVAYEEKIEGLSGAIQSFRPDFSYPLGRAIHDGCCRRPVFKWEKADVRITLPDRSQAVVQFNTELEVPMMNRRLNGAVMAGSASRAKLLARAVEECRKHGRKLIIFVGGDTKRKDGGGIKDATEYLPAELRAIGVRNDEMCVVASDDDDATAKVEAFGESSAWIMITVNMVSEGTDVPELSAALFLTCITARSTTVQRIGRILRRDGEAWIYMFEDPRYREIADSIEAEYYHEIELGMSTAAPASPVVPGNKADGEAMAIGLDATESGVTAGGVYYTVEQVRTYHRIKNENNLPDGLAYMSALLPLIANGLVKPQSSDPGRSAP